MIKRGVFRSHVSPEMNFVARPRKTALVAVPRLNVIGRFNGGRALAPDQRFSAIRLLEFLTFPSRVLDWSYEFDFEVK